MPPTSRPRPGRGWARIGAPALRAIFGPDVGFTRTRPNEITVINFRGESGLPFLMDDEAFLAAAQEFGESNADQLEEAVRFGVQSEYGYVHDWEADPEGQGVLAEGRLAGRSDLHSWLADRRSAFDKLLEEYEQRVGQEPALLGIIKSQPLRHSSCGANRKCGEMTSCEEARFYLEKCGVKQLDGDGDGVPCESLCR